MALARTFANIFNLKQPISSKFAGIPGFQKVRQKKIWAGPLVSIAPLIRQGRCLVRLPPFYWLITSAAITSGRSFIWPWALESLVSYCWWSSSKKRLPFQQTIHRSLNLPNWPLPIRTSLWLAPYLLWVIVRMLFWSCVPNPWACPPSLPSWPMWCLIWSIRSCHMRRGLEWHNRPQKITHFWLFLFALIYLLFGINQSTTWIWSLFAVFLWTYVNPGAPFIFGAILAVIAEIIFVFWGRDKG